MVKRKSMSSSVAIAVVIIISLVVLFLMATLAILSKGVVASGNKGTAPAKVVSEVDPYTVLYNYFMKHIYEVVEVKQTVFKPIILDGAEVLSETETHWWYINKYNLGGKTYTWEGRMNKKTRAVIARIYELKENRRRLDVVE